MTMLLFALPGNEALAHGVARQLDCSVGALDMHQFPDGEVNPRFGGDLAGHDVVLACTLDAANSKLLPLFLAASVARELGARSVGLLTPYLAYMRQDARFHPGEGITSAHVTR
jgi:ribose-phosphate pyrophosphokinase